MSSCPCLSHSHKHSLWNRNTKSDRTGLEHGKFSIKRSQTEWVLHNVARLAPMWQLFVTLNYREGAIQRLSRYPNSMRRASTKPQGKIKRIQKVSTSALSRFPTAQPAKKPCGTTKSLLVLQKSHEHVTCDQGSNLFIGETRSEKIPWHRWGYAYTWNKVFKFISST